MPHHFLHNIRTSVRSFSRSKIYTAINLTGLVFGLTAAFILIIFAINELSYNKSFQYADRIYRLIINDVKGIRQPLGPLSLKQALTKEIPEIEQSFRIIDLENFIGQVEIQKNASIVPAPKFYCADPEVFNSLQIKLISGHRTNLLKNPFFVDLSADAAKRLFPSTSPIGKSLVVYINGLSYNLLVEGVFENLPWNSTFKPEFISSIGLFKDILQKSNNLEATDESLENELTVETYVLLKQDISLNSVNQGLLTFSKRYFQREKLTFEFQNIKKIYLHSGDLLNDYIVKGSKENIYIYLSLAFFILLLATINYSMLSTARSALRFKEIGVRKVLGATKANLRIQLLAESMLMTVLAFPLAYLLLGLVAPLIEYYYSYRIFFFSTNLLQYVSISAGITIFIGLLSGSYIAAYLSSLDPLTALKSNYYIYKKVSFSKIFIVFQFLITIALFISLLTINQQIKLLLGQKNGVNKENLLVLSLSQNYKTSYQQLTKTLSSSPLVLSVTGQSISLPTNEMTMVNIKLPGPQKKKYAFETLSIDFQFFKTLGINFLLGSDFSPSETNTKSKMVIINEEAMNLIHYKEPVNKKLGPYRIIGVVKNFNIHTMHQKIKPTLFVFNPEECQSLMIRYKAGKEEDVLGFIRGIWQEKTPKIPLVYKFYDHELKSLYIKEQNFGRVIGSFTFLALIITGMGLFGLAMLIVERRMKEMSIRKVFGASNSSLIFLIQNEFILFVIIAATFAIPLAWYLLSLWLNGFYYRVPVQWYIFALAVIAVGGFVSLILLLKTLRILKENPSNALKYE